MNERRALLERITAELGDRSLVSFGIRGEDAGAYVGIPQFAQSFAITAPIRAASVRADVTLEEERCHRPDLDIYDTDLDPDDDGRLAELRRRILAACRYPSVLVTYRPSHFLASIGFASVATCRSVGTFKDHQSAFEHKPWVETQLRSIGVPTLPWSYVAEEHRRSIERALEGGPQILRPSRTSGGEGIVLVSSPEEMAARWPDRSDRLVSVAPYLGDAVPMNVGGCVYDRNTVRLHPASVQLIGIEALTARPFGYCGNDFAAVRDLPDTTLQTMEDVAVTVGRWLGDRGYVGAYGVDFLVDDGVVLFTEVNARLQGCSAPSAAAAGAVDLPDVLLEHLAAGLGLEPPAPRTLRRWAEELPPRSHAVVHNTGPGIIRGPASPMVALRDAERVELVPAAGVVVDPGGVLGRLTFDRSITTDGFALDTVAAGAVAQLRSLSTGEAGGRPEPFGRGGEGGGS